MGCNLDFSSLPHPQTSTRGIIAIPVGHRTPPSRQLWENCHRRSTWPTPPP